MRLRLGPLGTHPTADLNTRRAPAGPGRGSALRPAAGRGSSPPPPATHPAAFAPDNAQYAGRQTVFAANKRRRPPARPPGGGQLWPGAASVLVTGPRGTDRGGFPGRSVRFLRPGGDRLRPADQGQKNRIGPEGKKKKDRDGRLAGRAKRNGPTDSWPAFAEQSTKFLLAAPRGPPPRGGAGWRYAAECRLLSSGKPLFFMAIPHNSKCRYGERGAADAKPKAQIILDAAKVSAASLFFFFWRGNSEPKLFF